MANTISLEYCIECGSATERAGISDDSLYCPHCDLGPFCVSCYEEHLESCGTHNIDWQRQLNMIHLNITVTWQGNVGDDLAVSIQDDKDLDYLFELLHNSSCTKVNIEQKYD